MAKYCGKVGYAVSVATRYQVYEDTIVERRYFGDVTRNIKRREDGYSVNDNLVFNNEFSIIADAYAYEHYSDIRYIEWMGKRWKVTSVEVQRPRLILYAGGVWNGKTGASGQSVG